MRAFAVSLALLLSSTAGAAPPPAPQSPATIVADANAPKGKLPNTVTPRAYRLSLDVDPDQPRFFGHDEIDVLVNMPTTRIYMHGRDLHVARAAAKVRGEIIPARYTQVDPTGVVRLDFDRRLPAGPATLLFDYDAAFGGSASGMFHVKVRDRWYAWTQFESIDARAAFPSFDEPGFKTPFTISVLSKSGDTVITNSPEASATPVTHNSRYEPVQYAADRGRPAPRSRILHRFETTRPLPTYLVAIDTGPFVHLTGTISPDPQRSRPMPYGAVATQAQRANMGFVMAETPRIVSLLEKYFGQPFPFSKLDQIGTPIMPGAMENAGADTYGDSIIFLAPGATTGDKQAFGMVVSHELSHQWFGDLVTPAWWDDIWLNESFANWMGYRIGNEWRPDLNIGVGALAEGFRAMNTDALLVGRPIHQSITDNSQIDSAFDSITYGKGGQVVAMIAAYLGDEKFRQGVRLHLKNHAYGNATSDQFFQAIANAARDPKVLAAFRSFVDQQGVPLVTLHRSGGALVATQSRYAFLGSNPPVATWTVPLCVRAGTTRTCALLGPQPMTMPAPAGAVVMPNVGGTGYYRFELDPADWGALIAASAQLPPGEALATSDSLWASFNAGRAPASALIAEARAMAANPSAAASVDPGERLSALHNRGLIAPAGESAYRALIFSIYGRRLSAVGFDPKFGAHAGDSPDMQMLRQQLVELIALDARDPAVRATLSAAGQAYLTGNRNALDPAFLSAAMSVVAQDGGLPRVQEIVAKGLATEEADVREAELAGAASSGRRDVADYLLNLKDARVRTFDRLSLIGGVISVPSTRAFGEQWVLDHYAELTKGNGIFMASRLPAMFDAECDAAQAVRVEHDVGPAILKANVGILEYRRTLERIRNCGILKEARSAEITAALTGQ